MGCKQLLSAISYVQFPKFLGYYIGINETLLLSAYCDIDNMCEIKILDYDGWFYAKQEYIFTEIGLSEKQQSLAIKHLKDLKIISAKKAGNPAVTYYKLDEDILENVLKIAQSEYLSLKRQKVVSRGDETSLLRGDVSHSLHINNNNNKKNNKKEPEPEAQAFTVTNSRRNFREKTKPLRDLLNSGSYLDEQNANKRKSQKEKNKDNCLAMIQNTLYDDKIKSLLTEYYLFISDYKHATLEDRVKVISTPHDWQNKLNQLNELIDKGYDAEKLIQQSLNQRKYKFFPLQSVSKSNRHESLANDVVVSDPEWARRAIQEAIDNGEEFY